MAAAAATPSSGTSTMKLVVDKTSQRVLFAEAGKDVVDFLFGVLNMPISTVASLLAAGGDDAAAGDALGGFANVHASAENMDSAYMQCPEARDALIVNNTLPSGPSTRLLPTTTTSAATSAYAASATNTMAPASYYVWPSSAAMMPPSMPTGCPTCQTYAPQPYHPTPSAAPESAAVALQSPPDAGLALIPPSLYRCHACHALGSTQGSGGFVQAVASYTVMDDLTVKPATTVSTVALLATLGVKDIDALEERTVTVGRKECLEFLGVGLKSKTVLTDVFLPKTTKKRTRTANDKNDDDASSD